VKTPVGFGRSAATAFNCALMSMVVPLQVFGVLVTQTMGEV
jgi:hypothetical protein